MPSRTVRVRTGSLEGHEITSIWRLHRTTGGDERIVRLIGRLTHEARTARSTRPTEWGHIAHFVAPIGARTYGFDAVGRGRRLRGQNRRRFGNTFGFVVSLRGVTQHWRARDRLDGRVDLHSAQRVCQSCHWTLYRSAILKECEGSESKHNGWHHRTSLRVALKV